MKDWPLLAAMSLRRRGVDLTGRADLHYHPLVDEHAPYDPALAVEQLAEADLDVVAVTEHDRVDLALDLIERAARIGLRTEIVPGCEVTTAAGHVLGLWIDRAPAPGQSVGATVRDIHVLGGVAIAAHPLLPTCVSLSDLRASLRSADPAQRFDALEAANPVAAAAPLQAPLVERLAQRYRVAAVAGSDAHAVIPGKAITHFAGSSAADLRFSIAHRLTAVSYERSSRLALALAGPRYAWRALRRRAAIRAA